MGQAKMDSERMSFDKWQMYRLVRGEYIGPCRIPRTARLSAYNLNRFLKLFQRVYVKPTGSWGGVNISLVDKGPSSTTWTLQGKEPSFTDVNRILAHYRGVPAIVQQAIPSVLYHGCSCDVRVHMQRDINGDFLYAGDLVRVGGQGIVSNVQVSNGSVIPLSTALHELFTIVDDGADVLRRQLVEIGSSICRLFEEYAHIDEVGIDLALDAKRQFWLIEINTNDAFGGPSHELFRYLPDETIYNELQQRATARSLSVIQMFFDTLEDYPDEDYLRGDCQDGDCTGAIVCSDGNCTDGDCQDGDCMDGDCMDGDCMDGDCMDGDCMDGDCMDGKCSQTRLEEARGCNEEEDLEKRPSESRHD